jgi:hypothetical protein
MSAIRAKLTGEADTITPNLSVHVRGVIYAMMR